MCIIVQHANLVSTLQFEMKLQDPVPTFLRKGNIIMRHRGGIKSHRLTTQCSHAPMFYTRPISLLRHGSMYFVLLHALLLERRRLPSHTCFHIILIWWLSGLPFDLWPHANEASNTNFISKMSWSPPQFISKATMWVVNFDGGVVIVCDGGIDHNITKKPPPNKVSVIDSTIFPQNHPIYSLILSWS